jgi:hypothetical protein
LNVSGFLSYLKEEERFRSAETIHAPCGRANKLLYRDVKAICPAMKKLIHKTWLVVNGNVEYVVEGKSSHPCYRMYRHFKKYTEGETIWIRYHWDRRYTIVWEEDMKLLWNKQQLIRTDFYSNC